jgi:hypothetical protein
MSRIAIFFGSHKQLYPTMVPDMWYKIFGHNYGIGHLIEYFAPAVQTYEISDDYNIEIVVVADQRATALSVMNLVSKYSEKFLDDHGSSKGFDVYTETENWFKEMFGSYIKTEMGDFLYYFEILEQELNMIINIVEITND